MRSFLFTKLCLVGITSAKLPVPVGELSIKTPHLHAGGYDVSIGKEVTTHASGSIVRSGCDAKPSFFGDYGHSISLCSYSGYLGNSQIQLATLGTA